MLVFFLYNILQKFHRSFRGDANETLMTATYEHALSPLAIMKLTESQQNFHHGQLKDDL